VSVDEITEETALKTAHKDAAATAAAAVTEPQSSRRLTSLDAIEPSNHSFFHEIFHFYSVSEFLSG